MSDKQKTVLLIDDDPDMCGIVRAILEPHGFCVSSASTAEKGWQQAQKGPPALLIIDVMLATPTEGLELAHRFRTDDTLGTIPIVLISSINQAMAREYAMEAGMSDLPVTDFVEKPFEASCLLRVVESLAQS